MFSNYLTITPQTLHPIPIGYKITGVPTYQIEKSPLELFWAHFRWKYLIVKTMICFSLDFHFLWRSFLIHLLQRYFFFSMTTATISSSWGMIHVVEKIFSSLDKSGSKKLAMKDGVKGYKNSWNYSVRKLTKKWKKKKRKEPKMRTNGLLMEVPIYVTALYQEMATWSLLCLSSSLMDLFSLCTKQ